MPQYRFNFARGLVVLVAATAVVELIDDDTADPEEAFGQGDLLGEYFRGDLL